MLSIVERMPPIQLTREVTTHAEAFWEY
jgi:hypothetical protein